MKHADARGRFEHSHSVAVSFREMEGFAEDWKSLGYNDSDFFELQNQISTWPERGPVIAGTGGVRKLRFASSRQRGGKRGGARVCYAYFKDHGIVLLIAAYAKVKKSDLSADDKKAFRQLMAAAEKEHARRDGGSKL